MAWLRFNQNCAATCWKSAQLHQLWIWCHIKSRKNVYYMKPTECNLDCCPLQVLAKLSIVDMFPLLINSNQNSHGQGKRTGRKDSAIIVSFVPTQGQWIASCVHAAANFEHFSQHIFYISIFCTLPKILGLKKRFSSRRWFEFMLLVKTVRWSYIWESCIHTPWLNCIFTVPKILVPDQAPILTMVHYLL